MTERYFVSSRELTDVMRHLQSQGTYLLAGANSIYVPARKAKYIDRSVCKNWPDVAGQIRLMSPGEAAREELRRAFPGLERVGWQSGHIKLFDLRSPMHYDGPVTGKLIYLDLDAAYAQIYSKLWLDTPFPRGYGCKYPLAGVAVELEAWKVARNSLIGISRSREMTAYRGTKRLTIKMKNRYLSPGLWATVQSILHWIARKALDCGAIYINVDGYIFHADPPDFWLEFADWLTKLNINWSIRSEGTGEIVSWNAYQIGQFKTKPYKLGLHHSSKEFSNVNHHNSGWRKYYENITRIKASRNI